MSRRDDYERLLSKVSFVGDLPGIETVTIRMNESLAGGGADIILPSYNDDVLILEISPPIWGRDPEEETPEEDRKPSPPTETRIPIRSPTEKVATAYGVVAGANFLGSTWPAVRQDVKLGWPTFCSGRNISWESAEPQVRDAWNAVGSLFGDYRKA